MRTYQIRNAVEGLAGTKMPLIGAGLLAVLLGAAWSVVGHISSGNPSFLVYVLVTAVIYGLFLSLDRESCPGDSIPFCLGSNPVINLPAGRDF